MGRRSHEEEMTIPIGREIANEAISLVSRSSTCRRICARVCFVDDDEFGRLEDELISPPLTLDEVHRDDRRFEPVEYRFACMEHQAALHTGCIRRHDELGLDVKLGSE